MEFKVRKTSEWSKAFYVTVNELADLQKLSEDNGNSLLTINFLCKSITVDDDYLE